MPKTALVAFVVVLACGFSFLPAPARGSDVDIPEQVEPRPGDTAADISGQQKAKPALTLDDILTRTLRQNPQLSAYSREIEARRFETRQAGLRPNPELSLEVENIAGSGNFSGTDSAETTVRISQLVELGGKRKKRLKIGQLEHGLAEREYEAARSNLVANTRERFIRVLESQRQLQLATEQLELNRRILTTVEERIAAGKTPAIEEIRFPPLVTDARLRQEKARQALATARLALAAAWGADETDFGTVIGRLEELPPLPDWSAVVSRAGTSPQIVLAQAAVNSSNAAVTAERAGRIPDLTVSLGTKNDNESGDSALVAEISIPLQLFDRNQGTIGAARARLEKARDEQRSARLKMRTELAEAWQTMSTTRLEVDLLQEEILPAGQQAFDAVSYGYRAGKFGFLELLDAERTLFEAKSRHALALGNCHRAAARLERLLGSSLTDIGFDTKRGQS